MRNDSFPILLHMNLQFYRHLEYTPQLILVLDNQMYYLMVIQYTFVLNIFLSHLVRHPILEVFDMVNKSAAVWGPEASVEENSH